jgi:hypothetical protein
MRLYEVGAVRVRRSLRAHYQPLEPSRSHRRHRRRSLRIVLDAGVSCQRANGTVLLHFAAICAPRARALVRYSELGAAPLSEAGSVDITLPRDFHELHVFICDAAVAT